MRSLLANNAHKNRASLANAVCQPAQRASCGQPQALGAMPGRTLSGAAKGGWPAVKGYYRVIDKPDDSALNAGDILTPHRMRTIRRMMAQSTVLCIQDGTDLSKQAKPGHITALCELGVKQPIPAKTNSWTTGFQI